MRDIRFRWWNKELKSMVSWEEMLKECNRLSILEPSVIGLPQWIPMQFTSLHDKNGERDI